MARTTARSRVSRVSAAAGVLAVLLAGCPGALRAAEEIGSGNCRVQLLGPDDSEQIPSSYRTVVEPIYGKHRLVVEEGLRHMTLASAEQSAAIMAATTVEELIELGAVPDSYKSFLRQLSAPKAPQEQVTMRGTLENVPEACSLRQR